MAFLVSNLTALFGPARATLPERRALIRLVATAAENCLPLPTLLDAWAEDSGVRQRGRLQKLATALKKGVALPDALELQPHLLTDQETLTVRFASESGTLASTLRHHLKSSAGPTPPAVRNTRHVLNYGLLIFLVGLPIAFSVQNVMTSISDEFGIELSRALQVGNLFRDAAVVIWLLWLVVLVVTLGSWLFDWPLRFFHRVIAPRLSHPLRSRRVASVLRSLGESASGGRPITGAIATLARYHYDPRLRHQLLDARNELGLGAELWPTLAASGLLTATESAALVASDRLGTRGWTLQALADVRERDARAQVTLQSGILLPLVVLVFGGFVALQALGVFTFFVQLIDSLA